MSTVTPHVKRLFTDQGCCYEVYGKQGYLGIVEQTGRREWSAYSTQFRSDLRGKLFPTRKAAVEALCSPAPPRPCGSPLCDFGNPPAMKGDSLCSVCYERSFDR